MSRGRRGSPVDFAIILLGLNEKNKAIEKLERAYRERDGRLVQLKVNPIYESLEHDAGYRSLLKKINLVGN